jgi:hypothetical protein
MNRTWDQSTLDCEPCKDDEWLSEMENRDVSAPELADVHVPERKWLARERRVKIGTHDMLRARVKLQKLSSCRNCSTGTSGVGHGRHRARLVWMPCVQTHPVDDSSNVFYTACVPRTFEAFSVQGPSQKCIPSPPLHGRRPWVPEPG